VWGVGCGGTSPTDTEEYREIETQLDTARAKIADLESQLDAAANSGAPSAPRGVSVVTGDGDVTVSWLSNPEEDLDGYDILRSRRASQGFAIVGSVGRASTSYADPTAENGTTYYYGVVAIDEGGNVSDRSRDRAVSTPRPQGEGIELGDIDLDPTRAGIRLSEADRGPVHWDADGDDWLDDDLDIAYWLDGEFGIPYFLSDHDDVFMQDLGFHMTLQAIDSVPTEGYTSFSTEIVEGHLYAFLTRDGNYAKVRVTDVAAEAVTFDWAYQTVEDNPNVAPARNPRVVAAGRRRAQ
jgi:hypothetical protein